MGNDFQNPRNKGQAQGNKNPSADARGKKELGGSGIKNPGLNKGGNASHMPSGQKGGPAGKGGYTGK